MAYDLTTESWIPLSSTGGRVRFRGLQDTLTDADRFDRLVADTPLCEGALLRLLVAIAHRVADVSNVDEWLALREQGHFDRQRVLDYFSEWQDRFDLFSDTHPFYQDDAISHVEAAPISRLALFADGSPMLRVRWEKSNPPVFPLDKAVRHLLSYMTFDVGGFKSRAFPGENHSAKEAPLRSASMVVVQGRNLFETILLNMGIYDPEAGDPWVCDPAEDLPAWERDEENAAGPRDPRGYLDWLTLQSRRVLLHPEYYDSSETGVRWVSITKGETLGEDFLNRHRDPMVPYRWLHTKNESFQVPLRFTTDRGAWRNGYALLCATGASSIDCRNVRLLIDNGLVSSDPNLIDLRILGMGSDRSKILFLSSDGVRLPAAYLADDAHELRNALRCGVEVAEECSRILRSVMREESPSSLGDIRGNEITSMFWASTEDRFATFVSRLPLADDYDRQVRLFAESIGDVADKALESATVGSEFYQKLGRASSKLRGILYSVTERIVNGGEDDDNPD